MSDPVVDEDYESIPNSNAYINMLAGAIAGITEHVATYPLDVLKTRMQVTSASNSIIPLMKSVYSREGFRAFSRGINSVILSAGPAHAFYFGAYEQAKVMFVSLDPSKEKHFTHASAGIVATLCHDSIVTPFDVVKQRMQLGQGTMSQSILRIYKNEGLAAFYISFPTTIMMSIPFQSIQFTTYETARKYLNPSGEYSPLTHCVSGGISGAFASIVTNPLDVAKTALQTRGLAPEDSAMRKVKGIRDTLATLTRENGMRWLTRGIQARVLANIPSTAVAWTTYEFFKFTLHKTQTDKHLP